MSEIAALTASLTGTDSVARLSAAEELSRLGAGAQPAALALVRAVADESEEVREFVTATLEDLGPPFQGDASKLIALLSSENADVAYWSATLLGRLGADASAAVPELIKAMTDAQATAVQQRAAWALGAIGASAKSALDALKIAAGGNDARLARLAHEAIDAING